MCKQIMELESIDFYGLKISVFTKEEIIESIVDTVNSTQSKIYYGYSLAVLIYLKKHSNYLETTSKFDVMVTDGRLFFLLAKFFGFKLKFDLSIAQLTLLSLDIANNNGYRIMLLGGTEETNKLACNKIKHKYPNIIYCEGINGYFSEKTKNQVFHNIKTFNPDILLIGMPTPKKQLLASELKSILSGCVIIPCGGMIDVIAGKEKLTPNWLKKIGLASIFRHIQHPKRIPELISIYFLAIKIFSICFYLKFIKKSKNISIPSLLLNKK